MKTYHIKQTYIHKTVATEVNPHSGYWNEQRIYASGFHQYGVYKYAGRVIKEHSVMRVLDVGCGPATKLAMLHRQFPAVDFFGVDTEEAIRYCENAHSFGAWLAGDFNNHSANRSFVRADLIICSDVIEHVADPDLLVDFIRKNLAGGGQIILSTPERDVLSGKNNNMAANPFHVREWNYEEIRSYVRSHGFLIEAHELQWPVRFWPNMIFCREVLQRVLSGKSPKYNQVLLLREA